MMQAIVPELLHNPQHLPALVNKPSPPFIVHGLDKPGGFTTVSEKVFPSKGNPMGACTGNSHGGTAAA
jgi:hypothetical protein